MPMYAPMAAVATQVPVAAVRALARWRVRAFGTDLVAQRACAAAAVGALVWQVGGLVRQWPERETALHGLGGPAAHAAATADRVAADVIYVASIDGTPRRYGAGMLPGLRYPWFKWFDPSRSLPLSAAGETAVYMESELRDQRVPGDLVACLGAPDAAAERIIGGAEARQLCLAELPKQTPVTLDGVARVDAVGTPDSVAAGDELETRLVWEPLVARPEPQQMSLQLDDPLAVDGTQWGNGTLDLYPAAEWQPGELLLSRLPVRTDATALPQRYRLTLGVGPTRANAPAATRVAVATVALTPATSAADQPLPADMRAIDGAPLLGGGLELIAARPLPVEAAVGSPLRIGLVWRAVQDGPSAAEIKMRLIRANGDVVQESVLPLLGGRLSPSALRKGSVVRDEEALMLGPRLPGEPLTVEVNVVDAWVPLGSVKVNARSHEFAVEGARAQAAFGGVIDLLEARLEPAELHGGGKLTVKLRWRGAAEMAQAYKVFVHMLDPSGEKVVAQRDAEPRDGAAPTTGWLVGEVIEDEYAIALPPDLAAGDYPVEVGVYEARSGERLTLADGTNRFLVSQKVAVR
jgi:hypothetical protein